MPPFKEVAQAYIAAHEASWRSRQHRHQRRQTIQDVANPVLGDVPVDMITVDSVLTVIQPIWVKTPEPPHGSGAGSKSFSTMRESVAGARVPTRLPGRAISSTCCHRPPSSARWCIMRRCRGGTARASWPSFSPWKRAWAPGRWPSPF